MKFLPQLPGFPRAFGEQVLAREAHSHGETLRALTDQHDVAGLLDDGFGDERDILDVAHASDRPGPSRGPVHTAGVKFDHPFFVRQTTKPNAVVERIVFRPVDHAHSGIKRVAAVLQKEEGIIKVVESVIRADNDGPLDGTHRLGMARGLTLILPIQTGG